MKATAGQNASKLFAWFLVCCCFAGIPSLILYFSLNKHLSMAKLTRQESLKIELQKALSETSASSDIEKYWCRSLTDQFNHFKNQNVELQKIERWLIQTRQSFGECFDFIIWKANGEIHSYRLPQKPTTAIWYEVFLEMADACEQNNDLGWRPSRKANIGKIREILGPQYVGEMMEANSHQKLFGFAWPDSSMKKPLLWTYFYNRGGVLLFFDAKKTFSEEFPRMIVKQKSTESPFNWGLFSVYSETNPVWTAKNLPEFTNLEENLNYCEENFINFVETETYYLASAFLTAKLRIFIVGRKLLTDAQERLIPKLAAFILLVLMTPFYAYTFKTLVKGHPGSIKIRPRLAFMFFFANAVPFLAMSMVAQEYYLQKRTAFLKDMHKRSVDLLKDYDKRLETAYSRLEHDTQTFFDLWAAKLSDGRLTEKKNQQIIDAATQNIVDSFFLVSSNSANVGTYAGVKKVEESLEEKTEKTDKNRNVKKQFSVHKKDNKSAQIFNLIGKRIMNELNGISKTNQAATKIELLAESLLQKSFAEITHSFIKAMGGISTWGFGKIQNLTLLKFMSLPESDMVDFMAVVLWSTKAVQRQYLDNTILSINRNPLGLKVFARLEFSREFFPKEIKQEPEITAFIERATDRPSEEIETIVYDGKSYLAVCFQGKYLERYKIIGLLPLEKIDRSIGRQKDDLKMLGILSIFLGLLLAQMLARSFLKPLQQLTDAALAIENRDYKFRTRSVEKNEFGEIATIFDEVMIGLEELEVAKVVQESLFPESSLQQGKVKIFGKSITMAELGGDYFDFFKIDEHHCGALMGDVAGHGVGAALIMAMAKSGILSSSDYLKRPQKLLEKLHQLIYSSKTAKQKKIMTFQYLSIDSETGQGKYANAGACSPVLITEKGGKAQEVSLAGAALGAFKKGKFAELDLQFNSGDCIIFYTDGIIEARSVTGQEIGYENFLRVARESWSPDPETIYRKIYRTYLQHIGGQDAEDDLTMVIVVFS